VSTAEPTPQATDGVTWAAKLEKEEARLDWTATAAEIDRRVRGYHPWPGAFVDTAKGPLKIDQVAVRDLPGEPGVVLTLDPLVVGCGQGSVELVTVRPAGRKAMAGHQYANGARLVVGAPLTRQ
jgi:methionyl-tRNA formyltransferase